MRPTLLHRTPGVTNPLIASPTWIGYRGLGSLAPLQLVNLDPRQLDLDNCGAPEQRRTDLYVEFPVHYVYQIAWELDDVNAQFFLDERRPVSAKGDFLLDSVTTAEAVSGVSLRFVWPNGRFSANTRIPIALYFSQGDYAVQFLDPVTIPAAQWIGLELEVDAGTAAGTFAMSFNGRIRYYLEPRKSGGAGGNGRITR